MKVWQATSVEETERVAKEIIEFAHPQKKFAFYGEMGAGKTTLIKAMCLALGIEEPTSSPTFAIVNEYQGKQKIYHFDLFRLKNRQELLDIGFEEYLSGDHYIFIEWPAIAEPVFWHYNFGRISIELSENLERIITLER